MTSKEDKWAVVIWEYGRHCDEFIVEEVHGSYTFEEAIEIEASLIEKVNVTIAPMKEVNVIE